VGHAEAAKVRDRDRPRRDQHPQRRVAALARLAQAGKSLPRTGDLFCEYTDKAPKVPTWFALRDDRPLFFFAGIWCKWNGVRGTKANPEDREHTLFGFLTTEANATVRPVHAKAMPVILTAADELERWMTEPETEALQLQRPRPDGTLRIVARGEKEDAIDA
jgi:putative SOS response-associated peptidase YedK